MNLLTLSTKEGKEAWPCVLLWPADRGAVMACGPEPRSRGVWCVSACPLTPLPLPRAELPGFLTGPWRMRAEPSTASQRPHPEAPGPRPANPASAESQQSCRHGMTRALLKPPGSEMVPCAALGNQGDTRQPSDTQPAKSVLCGATPDSRGDKSPSC